MIKNILANFLGRFWAILSNYLFIPIYVKLLGLESYAVISFSLVILGIVSILDSGLTATLSKEFAANSNNKVYKSKLLASLESCYVAVALIIIIFFLCFSDFISTHWLTLENLEPTAVSGYLKILSIGIAFQMMSNFYLGGIIGLEKQVKANIYQVIWGVLKNGVVVILLYFMPTLTVFFVWQTVINLGYVLVLRYTLQSMIHGSPTFLLKLTIDQEVLKKVSRFAGGMFLIAIVSSINTQLDKLVISKLLKIEELGFYNIAGSMAQALLVIITPFSIALLPRFTVLFSEGKKQEASELFDKILLIVAILVFTGSANIIFNANDLFWAWTGDRTIADKVTPYMPYLTLGTSLLAILSIPFCIAIANSFTKLNNIVGIVSLMITIPGYWIMVGKFGPKGAAICWLFVNVMLTPIYFHYINKYFLKTKSTLVLLAKLLLLPALITFTLSYLFSKIHLENADRVLIFVKIGICTMLTFVLSCLVLISKQEIKDQLTYARNFLRFKK